jgi:hypothetical protein
MKSGANLGVTDTGTCTGTTFTGSVAFVSVAAAVLLDGSGGDHASHAMLPWYLTRTLALST